MEDDQVVLPLVDGSQPVADEHLVLRAFPRSEVLTEQHRFGADRPARRIDANGLDQGQWDGIADRVPHRLAAEPVRQRIGRSQADEYLSRTRVRRHFDLDLIVRPLQRPGGYASDQDIIHPKHGVRIAGTGGRAEMPSLDLHPGPSFRLLRSDGVDVGLQHGDQAGRPPLLAGRDDDRPGRGTGWDPNLDPIRFPSLHEGRYAVERDGVVLRRGKGTESASFQPDCGSGRGPGRLDRHG